MRKRYFMDRRIKKYKEKDMRNFRKWCKIEKLEQGSETCSSQKPKYQSQPQGIRKSCCMRSWNSDTKRRLFCLRLNLAMKLY